MADEVSDQAVTPDAETAETSETKATEPGAGESKPEKKPKVRKTQSVRKRPRHGKKYRALEPKVDKSKLYDISEAAALVKELSTSSFDGSVEIHIRLNVDTTKSDQSVRGTVSLPKGSGKTKRVAVVASDAKLKDAAGADLVGGKDLMAEFAKGKLDFDILIATPEMMPELAKLGKILGPRGLMPNPKTGTVTDKLAAAVAEFKGGKQEFKMDKFGIVHAVIGKVSFDPADITENAKAFLTALIKAKPEAVKSAFIKTITLAPTMGLSVKVDPKSI